MLSHFFKLSGLLSNLFFAEIYFSFLGRYLNKVTSPDCDEDCCERFFWDSHWYSLATAAGIHRNGGILALDFTDFWGGHSPRQVSLFSLFSIWISQIFEEDKFSKASPLSQIVLSLDSSWISQIFKEDTLQGLSSVLVHPNLILFHLTSSFSVLSPQLSLSQIVILLYSS